MIVFELRCARGHRFEGWFDSSEDCDSQKERGLIECPVCGEQTIDRQLSPVRSLRSRSPAQAETPPPEKPEAPEAPEKVQRDLLKAVKAFFDRNFDDVGAAFAKEALKIHYGVAEKRNIRGSSTTAEEEMLQQEGVSFFKVPLPKDLD